MTIRPLVLAGAAILALLLLLPATVSAQSEIDPEKYAKVKAGIVLNFARYTTWPEESFEDTGSPVVITVLGHDPMENELQKLIRGELLQGRSIELRRIDPPRADPRTGVIDQPVRDRFHEQLRESHLLYIAPIAQDYHDVLDELDGEDILTVSDIRDFASEGGMLGIAVRRGRVAFDANTGELKNTDLLVSSKLLRLARVVATRKREP